MRQKTQQSQNKNKLSYLLSLAFLYFSFFMIDCNNPLPKTSASIKFDDAIGECIYGTGVPRIARL